MENEQYETSKFGRFMEKNTKPLDILIFEDSYTDFSNIKKDLEEDYKFGKFDLKKEDAGNYDSIREYDVILSDLGFPTNYKITGEKIKNILDTGGQKRLEDSIEITKNIANRTGMFTLYADIMGLTTGLLHDAISGEKPSENIQRKFILEKYGNIENRYAEMMNNQDMGWYPLANEAKNLGRKINFYTHDPGHARFNLVLGLLTGHFTPQEVDELCQKNTSPKKAFSTKSKKLIVGDKENFDNWKFALKTAIDYQTRGDTE